MAARTLQMIFRVILKNKGLTELKSPQQKRVAERMNRKLAKAFSTAAYLKNRLPATVIKDKSMKLPLCDVMARNSLSREMLVT